MINLKNIIEQGEQVTLSRGLIDYIRKMERESVLMRSEAERLALLKSFQEHFNISKL